MSNYFDNQTNWSWNIDKNNVTVTTEHSQPKPHSHTLDITNVPIGEMVDNPGEIMGDAHRAASHDYKIETKKEVEKMGKREDFSQSLKVDDATKVRLDEVSKKASQQNNQKQTTLKRIDNGGRELGNEEGHGKLGREPANKVSEIRADMKATSKSKTSVNGQLSQNGKTVNNSGKSTTPTSTAHSSSSLGSSISGGKTASGHGNGSSGNSSGHGTSGGIGGGHGSSGIGGHGNSGNGHGGH